MTSTTCLVIIMTLGVLCLPDVTQSFVRKTRAFRSNNFQRLPFKRSSMGNEEGDVKSSLASFDPSWLFNGGGGDITVEEMAERLAGNRLLALDFVMSFMDTDGDRLISASELIPSSQRR
eukprot:TRINITY_DN185954_c0_g1_i1.p1 TRINITY_DN185954_c0_g1~~TRINITY_DN185954_c0_g1_i1.p1  ORF type:complete len:119 (+),score=18.42 TRINITY_DN185954_c0_g1_i1:62-418(+)